MATTDARMPEKGLDREVREGECGPEEGEGRRGDARSGYEEGEAR